MAIAFVAWCATLCAGPDARASDEATARDDEPQRYRVFLYHRPAPTNFLRLALEEIAILGAGSIEYIQNQQDNKTDWDLSFSADSFESKVRGRAVSFDANRFGTNWILHPLGGYLYYGAARGNRLGPFASLFVAATMSAAWEWVGEFREQVAVNDLIATPLGGLSLVEPLLQLGAWFERGRPTFARSLMATLLAPTKRVHDALDEVEPVRGLPRPDPVRGEPLPRGDLTARFFAGTGPTWESASREAFVDVSTGFRSHLFYAPSPYEPGRSSVWLNDGNLSTIRLDATLGDGQLVDARFATRVALFGHYTKDVVIDGGRPRGNATFLGLGTGIDYHWHRYQRTSQPVDDQIALVELLGSTFENWHVLGSLKIRTQVALALDFAGVTSLARREWIRTRGEDGLPTVLKTNGYTHAFGGTVAPQIHFVLPAVSLLGEARLDVFQSIIEPDRFHERYVPTVHGGDERFTAAVGVERSFHPNLDVGLKVVRTFRRSRLEDITRTFSDTGLRLEAALRL